MNLRYQSGDEIRIDDIVDYAGGDMRVVVIVPSGASTGFDVDDWLYMGSGVLLRDEQRFGLLWLGAADLDHECVLVRRADAGSP